MANQNKETVDALMKQIAVKIRKIRELRHMTRDQFCGELGDNWNTEYWGTVERGERNISLQKLLEICLTYNIPIESLAEFSVDKAYNAQVKNEVHGLIDEIDSSKQLEIIKKFITDIAMSI